MESGRFIQSGNAPNHYRKNSNFTFNPKAEEEEEQKRINELYEKYDKEAELIFEKEKRKGACGGFMFYSLSLAAFSVISANLYFTCLKGIS